MVAMETPQACLATNCTAQTPMSTSEESKQVEGDQDRLPVSAILGICLFAYFLLIILIMVARQFILARGYMNFGSCQKCCTSICCPSFDWSPCRCKACPPFTSRSTCPTFYHKTVSNVAWFLALPYKKATEQNAEFLNCVCCEIRIRDKKTIVV